MSSDNKLTWTNDTKRLGDLTPRPDNPRTMAEAQAQRLIAGYIKFGQPLPLIVNPDGTLNDGHQRLREWIAEFGADFEVDVRIPSRPLTRREWQELVVLLHEGATGEWNFDALAEWDGVAVGDLVEWGFSEATLGLAGFEFDSLAAQAEAERQAIKGNKPNPRQLPVDVIYTIDMADCTCCLAAQAGLGYGFRSGQYRLCPYCGELSGRHRVMFIDNDFKDYDHAKHLEAVAEHGPKYATVRDIMSQEQCKEAGIKHFAFEQIMQWAEELEQHAENVIVIPKYDCLADIPDRYVLGYSIPTSYAGTPIPAEMFRGRRVHLLGGSWKSQLEYVALLGDDVVSLDTNWVQLIARKWAQFVTPGGEVLNLTEEGYPWLINPRYAALAFSFGAIGSKINELYAGSSNPA